MNALSQALGSLAHFLETREVPYMVIGGIANLVWGEPRSTLDVDASVLVDQTAWPELIKQLGKQFHVLPTDPVAFLRDTHVLPLNTADHVRIDLLWATLPYEHQAIARATTEEVAGQRVRVCRPEDLIIHKIISSRPKDREDVRHIVRHQGAQLDRRDLTKAVRSLSRVLDQPDPLSFLNSCFRLR